EYFFPYKNKGVSNNLCCFTQFILHTPKTAQYIITLVSKEASKKWNEDVVDFVLSSYNQLF
ncbi:MAG: hypothetical protein K2N87_18670, partial [Eubacterium sp.]|nr:hypothetical protein [Eubacterium sp.]